MSGAIVVGLNLVHDSGTTVQVIGTTWEGVEHLITAQLNPAAKYSKEDGIGGFAAVEVQVTDTAVLNRYSAVALLGADLGDSANALVLEAYDSTTGWNNVRCVLHRLRGPARSKHYVIQADSPLPLSDDVTKYRVRWPVSQSDGYVGAVYVGRLLQSAELADEGLGVTYIDAAGRTVSGGGQIYTNINPQVSRLIQVPQQALSALTAIGVVPHGNYADLHSVTPTVTGGVTYDSGTRFAKVGASASGNVSWGGVVPATNAVIRLDYYIYNEGDGGVPPATVRWTLNDMVALNYTSLGTGRHSVYFRNDLVAPDLEFTAAVGDGTSYLRPLALSVTGTTNYVLDRDLSVNLIDIVSLHGVVKPIIFMPFPNDPARNEVLSIYGYLDQDVTINALPGQNFSSRFSIVEQR